MRVTDNCLQWLETCLAGERVESDHAVATGFAFAIETVVNERPDRNELDIAVVVGDEGRLVARDTHDDGAVVAQFCRIERLAVAGAHRRDQRPNLFEGQDLVFAGALHVQDLALERQDGLEAPIAALLG